MNTFPYIVIDSNNQFVKGFKGMIAAMNYAERKGLKFEFNYAYDNSPKL